uniref:Uncharacterized protein n=1 Tax=Thermofilum pendens TaxID=2269 RepID=A0A7C3WNX8_THEPE
MAECAARATLGLLLRYIVALSLLLIGLAGSLIDWSSFLTAILPATPPRHPCTRGCRTYSLPKPWAREK